MIQGAIDDEDDGVDVEAMTYEELTALGQQIGTQSKGLCVEVIDALPVRRYVSTCGGGDGEAAAAAASTWRKINFLRWRLTAI